jgi:DsbC/DsbD-like thiol-disulfide interchange protein
VKLTAVALVALAIAAPAAAAADPARYMPAKLIAESAAPASGSTVLVGFEMTPQPGWHGYWSNPGDSGIAPTVSWTTPDGVHFGPLLHPAPTLLTADGIGSYVHDGPHVLLSKMSIPRGLAPGTPIPVEARLSWAACTATQCVPLHATFKLSLLTGDGAPGPDRASLRAAAARLPDRAPAGTFTTVGDSVRLLLPAGLKIDRASARFYPDRNDAFATAHARAIIDGGRLALTADGHPGEILNGVVSDGRRSYRLEFTEAAAAAPEEAVIADEQSAVGTPEAAVGVQPARQPATSTATPAAAEPSSRSWPWLSIIALVLVGGAAIVWARRRRA